MARLFTHSIRWRLQVWYGLILLAVLSGFGMTAWRLLQQRTLRTAEERAMERMETASRAVSQLGRPPDGPPGSPGGVSGGPPGFGDDRPPPGGRDGFEMRNRRGDARAGLLSAYLLTDEVAGGTVTIWRRDGTMLASTAGDPAPDLPESDSGKPVFVLTGNTLTLTASTPPGETIVVTRDLSSELAALRATAWQLAGAGTGVLLLGLLGGWWAAGRALLPISVISSTAQRLTAGNLSERIDLAGTEDELGQLAGVLNATLARLDDSFTRQSRFISDAAHELRTPVTVMLTQTQTALLRDRPAADYRQSLEACQRAAGRMRQLIESLLALARLDTGHQPMKRLRFDLSRAITDQVELLSPLAAARQITVIQEAAPLVMEGDPDYLTLVISNLLTNAIHYNREGGSIRIVLRREAGQAILTVADTGEGIAPEDVPRLFDRFFRTDQSRSLPAGRTGLGLAITQSILHAHGGSIAVASTPGEGTTFSVRIPLQGEARAAEGEEG